MTFHRRMGRFLLLGSLGLCLMPVHAAVVTLFEDDFDITTNGTSTISSPSTAEYNVGDETDAYDVLDYVYYAGGAVKLAKDGEAGRMVTTNLSVQAGVVTVAIDAIGYNENERDFTITIGTESHTLTCTDDRSSEPYDFDHFTNDFQVAAGIIQVSVSTVPGVRVVVDNLRVTQDVVSGGDAPDFSIAFTSGPMVRALTEVVFSVSAMVTGTAVSVSYSSGLPEGAVYAFSEGVFSWATALDEVGTHTLVFSAPGADGQPYPAEVFVTVEAYPLSAPVPVAEDVTHASFTVGWEPVPPATEGYGVSVWRGSTATNTPDADLETFFETTDNNPVQPLGWTFVGITGEYMDKGLNEIALKNTGEAIITRLYPAAVTNLSFRVQGRSTGDTNNTLNVYASATGGTWSLVGAYSSLSDEDGDDENNIFTVAAGDLDKSIALSPESGWRQFKFVYNKAYGNIGIGAIAAGYEGAGTRFLSGWESVQTALTGAAIGHAKPGTVHYVRVAARNADAEEAAILRVLTLPAPSETLLLFR